MKISLQQKSFNSYRLLFSALFASASKFVIEPEIVFIALVSEELSEKYFVTQFRRIQQNLASDSYQPTCFLSCFFISVPKSIQTFRLNVTAVASRSKPSSCDPNQPLLITGILELQTSYFDILIRTIIECQ